jgi:hypothetical protein
VRQHPLRYDAGKADDHTLAALIACLQRVPGVVSASLEDHDY